MSSDKYFQSLIEIKNHQPVTTSLDVARVFHKRHKNVIQSIRKFVAENSATRNMFAKATYVNRGRQYLMYYMNKYGFELLGMSFTGKLALQFKLAFMNAFDAMQRQVTLSKPSYQIADPIKRAEQWIKEAKHTKRLEQEERDHSRLERVFRSTKTNVPIGQVAKVISNTGHYIGRNNFFKWLRHNHYLISRGRQYNVPYQKYIELGLFKVTEHVIHTANDILATTVLVTPKGQQYFVQKFLSQEV